MHEIENRPERAMLIALDTGEYDTEISLLELEELAKSAGAEVIMTLTQKRAAKKAATCIGSGMAQQAADMCKQEKIDLVVFDLELTPTQIRNLEQICDVRVIDRTMLILDIFSLRAISREGKLQVELAQLQYMIPRLTGKGIEMSRLGGGIGTRGPGETKLETDRRHIRRRIENLKEQLKKVESVRAEMAKRRRKENATVVALVGYTNVGKSTLMNYLTKAGVLAENKLFATLDPTSRSLQLPSGKTVILIDTVGLVRRLPHHLVEAFHSTLEQAASADIVLNICDASSEDAAEHLEVTSELLQGLHVGDRPIIPVLNKWDLVVNAAEPIHIHGAVRISAVTGEGIVHLLEVIEKSLPERTIRMELLIPFEKSGIAAALRSEGEIVSEEFVAEGLRVTADVTQRHIYLVKNHVI